MEKIILITGASSGIGFATAEKLVNEGHVVYGTARKAQDLAKIQAVGVHPLMVEMEDYQTIKAAVAKVIVEQKRIDVLFNNAGYGLYGTVEETSIDDAKNQFEVNLFALARITQLVLPHMRKQHSGTIISTSSIGGKIYTPLGAWYHASKHALEGWSDCLRIEVAEFGIKVVIVEPGGIKTPWGARAADNLDRISSEGPYQGIARKTAAGMRKTYTSNSRFLSPPSVIANTVAKAINANHPKTRYAAGRGAGFVITARKYLSDTMFDRLITRMA